jgi:Protein of unknown function (DUF4038)/Putative collagen-binding domain of a collagenase
MKWSLSLTTLFLLCFFSTAHAVTIGAPPPIFTAPDNGNANLLITQQATLSQSATLKSLSFYAAKAAGSLILGVYDATGSGGRPGKLLATTAKFTPVVGWNTQSVLSPIGLSSGTYWLAYFSNSNNLAFVKQLTGRCYYYSLVFGAMPATFSSSPTPLTVQWSFYATLNATTTPSPTPLPSATPFPSATPSPSPTPSPSATPIPSPTPVASPSPKPSPTPNPTPLPTATPAPTATPKATPSPTPSAAVAYPIKASSNNRYLVDQNNHPFLLVGDAAWNLFMEVPVTGSNSANTYFAARKAMGFNSVMSSILGLNGGQGTYDGLVPFSTPGNITTPNEAYFARIDAMINLAATYGINIMLNACENYNWESVYQNSTTAQLTTFGHYLGNRYKAFSNVMWCHGNDYQDWRTNSSAESALLTLINAIISVDPGQIHTWELNYNHSLVTDDPNWRFLPLNGVYSYYPSYAATYEAYLSEVTPAFGGGTFSGNKPNFLVENSYEGPAAGDTDAGTPQVCRKNQCWVYCSGASAGYLYGNNNLYLFASGWANQINTPGATQLTYITNFLQRAPWYNLVPDLSHTFVTAGYGTAFPLSRLVPTNATQGTVIPDTYVTASITPDGTFAIAYLPVSTTINVAMNQFSGSVTAVWMDPSNNTFSTVTGGPFSNSGTKSFTTPGNNSAGNPDWVLYFTGSGTGLPTPTPSPSPALVSNLTSTLGDSTIEANGDSGNAGYLIVQSATLASTATLQTLSFYVTNSAGSLILGLYDATGTGGGPGKLLATTASFATVSGWNTQPVSATVLAAGTYWLAYTPSSNSLAFDKTSGGQYFAAAKAFGAMPSTFPLAGASSDVVHWSFYGTVTP